MTDTTDTTPDTSTTDAPDTSTTGYTYRNLPLSEEGWNVSGCDRVIGGCGVLEWCESEEDALRLMAEMNRDPRFTDLRVDQTDPRNKG